MIASPIPEMLLLEELAVSWMQLFLLCTPNCVYDLRLGDISHIAGLIHSR